METVMKRRSLLALPTAVAAVLAGTQFAGAALIYGKAWLAPVLIERAWGEARASGRPVKPMPAKWWLALSSSRARSLMRSVPAAGSP